MKTGLSLLCFLLLTVPALAGRSDTLRYCDARTGMCYYRNPMIVMQAARFELVAPGRVTEIVVTLGGESTGSATLHLYGREGGTNAPFLERDLMPPLHVAKTAPGSQTIHLPLRDPIFVESNQVFVALNDATPGVRLLSDRRARQPFCSAAPDYYYYQFMKLSDDRWLFGEFSYAVDLIVEYPAIAPPAYLKNVTASLMPDTIASANRSISWADFDDDGYLDLLVGGRLYRNERGTAFRDVTAAAGVYGIPRANAFIDMNNDGLLDILFIGSNDSTGPESHLFLNTGDAAFAERPVKLNGVTNPTSFSIADINDDGYPDIFVGQSGASGEMGHDELFLNEEGTGFTERSTLLGASGALGLLSRGSQWVDVDNDRRLDLFVATDRVPFGEVWHNNGDGSFTRGAFSSDTVDGANRRAGCHWADYDNDGDMDLLLPRSTASGGIGDLSSFGSRIVVNSGDAAPLGMRAADPSQIVYETKQTGGAWGDIDNDGLLDFVMTTSCDCRYVDLYMQQPGNRFEQRTFEYGLQRVAAGDDAIWVDYDNDGKLDLVTIVDDRLTIFRNTSPNGNNYVEMDVEGSDAIGGRVTLYVGDARYTREIASGRGLLMQDPLRLHFGVDRATHIDSAIVRWNNGTVRTFTDLDVNTILDVAKIGIGSKRQRGAVTADASPNPFSTDLRITYDLPVGGHVRLAIYTVDGGEVATLVDADQGAGQHEVGWNGDDSQGGSVAQGTYVYRLTTSSGELFGKVLRTR